MDYSQFGINELYRFYYLGDSNETLLEELTLQLYKYVFKAAGKYKFTNEYNDIVMESILEIFQLIRARGVDVHNEHYNFIGYCSYCIKHAARKVLIKEGYNVVAFDEEFFEGNLEMQKDISGIYDAFSIIEVKEILSHKGMKMRDIEWMLENVINGTSFIELARHSQVSDSYVSRQVKQCLQILKKEFDQSSSNQIRK